MNYCSKNPNPTLYSINFDVFGQDFQEKYGLFQQKGIGLAITFGLNIVPALEAEPTEAKLYEVLTALLSEPKRLAYRTQRTRKAFPHLLKGGSMANWKEKVIRTLISGWLLDKYLHVIDSVQERIYYGSLEGDIGYIYLPEIYDEPGFF